MSKRMKLKTLAVNLLLVGLAFSFTDSLEAVASNVKTTIHQAVCTIANNDVQPINIHIWYPSNTQEGPYPLVIFAYGFLSGNVTQSKYITQGLAQQGYIVCAATYEDFVYYQDQKKSASGYWDISSYAKAIIDEMLRLNNTADSPFYGIVDENNIGVCGYFPGSWTSEALYGAIPLEYQTYIDKRVDAGVFYAPANVITIKESNATAILLKYTITLFDQYLKGKNASILTQNTPPLTLLSNLDTGEVFTDTTTTTTENYENGQAKSEEDDDDDDDENNNGSNNQVYRLPNKSLATCPIVNAAKQIQQKRQSDTGNDTNLKDKIGNIFEGKDTIFGDKFNNIFTAQKNLSTNKLTNLSNTTILSSIISTAKQRLSNLNLGSGNLLNSGLLGKSLGNLSTFGSGILSHLSSGNLSGIPSLTQSLPSLNFGSGNLLGSMGNLSALGSGILR